MARSVIFLRNGSNRRRVDDDDRIRASLDRLAKGTIQVLAWIADFDG